MFNRYYATLFDCLAETPLKPWLQKLPKSCQDAFEDSNNGHLPKWEEALEGLPKYSQPKTVFTEDVVSFGSSQDISPEEKAVLEKSLRTFHPWRKGPFDFFGIRIDTEWRSNLKWNRLSQAIAPLKDRLILDIGSGNGYYGWRMLGQGAKLAFGADPFLLYVAQNFVARHYADASDHCYVLPFGIEALPPALPRFDTVFSMGVLYHRRSPIDHIIELSRFLRDGGEIVLETLVVDGPEGYSLFPEGRYAKMRNVWLVPSPLTVEHWLKRALFKNIRLIDVSVTTSQEQRKTDWMQFESLEDFLDPSDSKKTIEGQPAPKRAIFIANK